MRNILYCSVIRYLHAMAIVLIAIPSAMAAEIPVLQTHWDWCGWGGGGFYWSAAFHPTRDGTIYMGGDVAGVYKTEDHGQHWRLVNDGLARYEVYSLAVDPQSPETVYAATPAGLCKSTDGAGHWQLLPKTEPKGLRITGERHRSVHAVAVDPTRSNVVYAGNVDGRIYKSTDGGQTWRQVYQVTPPAGEPPPPADVLRAQFGGVTREYHGGFWLPLPPATKDCRGLGISLKANGTAPKNAGASLWTSDGAVYKSKDIASLLANTERQDVWLSADDFTLDAWRAKDQPEKAKSWTKRPDFGKANRLDFFCVNMDNEKPTVVLLGNLYFAPDKADKAGWLVARDFAKDKSCHVYGNAAIGAPKGPSAGVVATVAVAPKEPAMVLGATELEGVVMSTDSGETWKILSTPKRATSVVVAPSDSNILFATFGAGGIWKSVDKGKTWTKSLDAMKGKCTMLDVAVSPVNAQDVYAIGNVGWAGHFYSSHDGGSTWTESNRVMADPASPLEDQGHLSWPTNVVINPRNPQELFLSANWRPCLSSDDGRTLKESDRGADITCFADLQFHGRRAYATAMDEGLFVSEDNGGTWRRIWNRRKYDPMLTGHVWRVAVGDNQGKGRIIATCSPWAEGTPNYVIVSEDGGADFKVARTGLPTYRPTANTMWGMSYPRGLAVDPTDPKIVYLGMDGDAGGGQTGGGVFKSLDGGHTWKQVARQPGSRRAFYGLAIDPTDPTRLYWGACGTGGGLWRSEDAGESWKLVWGNNSWVFNVLVTADGAVYCPTNNLWRSTDHGNNWKQLTHFKGEEVIVGLEVDPRDPKTLWLSRVRWGLAIGGVSKTTDGGATWQDITGDLPYRTPLCLRFNPETQELWAVGVCAFKIRQ